MLTYQGKYNIARVMVDEIDEETVKQIYSFLNHPAFADTEISIMPDTHAGAGAVIGFTMHMNSYVIPNVVGVDIGCGIETYKLTGIHNIDFSSFDNWVRKWIPSGFCKRNKSVVKELTEEINHAAIRTEQDHSDVLHSLGTLGGGNHFIEIDVTDSGEYWLSIHTGSRHFGLSIAKFYQKKAKENMEKIYGAPAYRDLEYLEVDNGGKDYLEDMKIAQKYAEKNRFYIASDLLAYFGLDVNVESIKSVHNYIGSDNILRKGAISAYTGQKVIIPLNMRDGVIIGTGKSCAEWNYSAPHGAGRIYSRSKAKKELSIDEFKNEMIGIWSSCINKSTLDESPMAYKDKDLIINAIKESVDINFIMKPVYNFKASEEV